MQFNVPQFIEMEDKIFGPLTLKQFLIVAGVGAVLFIIWYTTQLWFTLLVSIPIVIGLVAVIFIKVNGRPFSAFFFSWLNYWTKPRFYVWKKK